MRSSIFKFLTRDVHVLQIEEIDRCVRARIDLLKHADNHAIEALWWHMLD